MRGEPYYFHDSVETKNIRQQGNNLEMLDPDIIEIAENVNVC